MPTDDRRPPGRSERRLPRAALVAAILLACAPAVRTSPPSDAALQRGLVPALLDRYLAGEFDAVIASVGAFDNLDKVINGLDDEGDAWIDRADTADRKTRRQLAAAAFALESARLGVWNSWKIRQLQNPPLISPDFWIFPEPPDILIWSAPPRLIEWACRRFRRSDTPTPAERWWQLGAIAVAERAEDPEFLVGDTRPVGNPQDEVRHLEHALQRFPDEPRFLLVPALTLDWVSWPERPRGRAEPGRLVIAMLAYRKLIAHEALGAEATIRLGVLELRRGEAARAIALFTDADEMTRDKYLVYLGRYLRGRAHEALRQPAEALAAYRSAVDTLPGAQAAALSLASLLASDGRIGDAQAVVASSASTIAFDPWRGYADADDRFWPEIRTRLRLEIAR